MDIYYLWRTSTNNSNSRYNMRYLILFLLAFNFAFSQTVEQVKQETQALNTKTFNLLDELSSQVDSLTIQNNILQSQLDNCGRSGSCVNGITAFPYTQGFESNFGLWLQSSNDDLDWSRIQGRTPSSNTGASSAIEGNYYIYVEASGSGSPNKRAILTSPCFDLTNLTEPVFSFKYHQNGATDMGVIDLEISSNNGASWSSIWQSAGSLGDEWKSAEVDISPYIGQSIELRFNRVTGNSWQTDLCIDDIRLGDKQVVTPPNQPVKAFPSAEGFGKNATGGRGGRVIKVTNLNDSGAGSFRQAAQYSSGARIIVFEVGGTITLNSVLSITDGDLTIAGQTATGDGILIRGSMVIIEDSNVIVRYLRFRSGAAPANTPDALNITAWGNSVVEDIIIDHCSLSWATDENFDIRVATTGTVRNVTIQNSIISESTYGTLGGARTFNKTYYKNYLAHNQERNIMAGGVSSNELDVEMINNLVYGVYGVVGLNLGSKHTILNNHFRNSSQQSMYPTIVDYSTSPQNVNGQGTFSETYAYISGNLYPSGSNEYSTNVIPYIKTTPYLSSGINAIPANQVASDIMPKVGCSFPNRDAVDIRLINQYNTNTGRIATSGTYPTISGGVAPTDANNDGIPDSWANANMPSGANYDDIAPSGYTWIEQYINGLVD